MSETLRVLIVDDEPLARAFAREVLQERADVQLVGEAADGFAAVKLAAELQPQVVLLDVQMPRLTGFEAYELLDPSIAVIFTTAHDAYAVRAFEVHAVDYVLKPFSAERLGMALDRARLRLKSQVAAASPTALNAASRGDGYAERLVVRDGAQVVLIGVPDLDCALAQGDYVELHSRGKSWLKQQTLTHLEACLDPQDFVRIHRSCLINVKRLARIEASTKDTRIAVLSTGQQLPISRAGQARLTALLGEG